MSWRKILKEEPLTYSHAKDLRNVEEPLTDELYHKILMRFWPHNEMIKDKIDYPRFLSMLELHEKAEYRLWLKWLKELSNVQTLSDKTIEQHLNKRHKQWDDNRQSDYDYR